MGDVKAYLRKMDFPDVVPEALSHMQKLWLPDCTTQQLSMMKELSQEFVFFEVDQWGHVREQKMSAIKELQILERICSFFKEPGPEQKRATFIFLFPFGTGLLKGRLPLLNKIVSLAIAIGNSNVLAYVGSWMQLVGCCSKYSMYIAKNVQQERLRPNSYSTEIVKNLPNNSELFCASVLTSIANMYLTELPPDRIVETVLEWFKRKPMFCFQPLNVSIPKTFNFPMGPQTPLAELIHWTVVAGLSVDPKNSDADKTRHLLYSSLQLSVLESITQSLEICMASKWEAVRTQRMMSTVMYLKSNPACTPEAMSLGLERFAQNLELTLAKKCINPRTGKIGELIVSCLELPFHQLLKIVLQKWSHELEGASDSIMHMQYPAV